MLEREGYAVAAGYALGLVALGLYASFAVLVFPTYFLIYLIMLERSRK